MESVVAKELYNLAIGDAVKYYMESFHLPGLETIMENRAVQTLEAIRRVLEDERYDDPECFERVDALVMLYFRELGIRINRHDELE